MAVTRGLFRPVPKSKEHTVGEGQVVGGSVFADLGSVTVRGEVSQDADALDSSRSLLGDQAAFSCCSGKSGGAGAQLPVARATS